MVRPEAELEVELKLPLGEEEDAVRARIEARWGPPQARVRQEDLYFAHPCRDLAARDEAVRIRRSGDRTFLTYKGPKESGRSKARREVELAVASFETARAFLEALGFRPVAWIRKERLLYRAGSVTLALDRVEGLGAFLELETVGPRAHLAVLEAQVRVLARELGLDPERQERRSYLELWLEKEAPPPRPEGGT